MLSSRPNPGSRGLALVTASFLDAADVPTPKVTAMAADKPGTAGRNYPFFATDIVLANFGYVEEEFMYRGDGEYLRPTGTGRQRRGRRARHSVPDAVDRAAAGAPVTLQRRRHRRMVQRDQPVRHRRAVAVPEGVLHSRGIRVGRRVGTERRTVRRANGAQGLESGPLRNARRHQRRQDHRRRARGGHLLASRDGHSPRARGARRTQAHVSDRRRPIAVGRAGSARISTARTIARRSTTPPCSR